MGETSSHFEKTNSVTALSAFEITCLTLSSSFDPTNLENQSSQNPFISFRWIRARILFSIVNPLPSYLFNPLFVPNQIFDKRYKKLSRVRMTVLVLRCQHHHQPTANDNSKSSGLGLYQANLAVQRLKGEIRLINNKDYADTFIKHLKHYFVFLKHG